MRTSEYGLDLIKKFEDLKLKIYKDAGGKWTIGYGHLIKDNEELDEIDLSMATKLLQEDLKDAENAVNKYCKSPISQKMFDALVAFVFNVGPSNFKSSTLLKLLNQKKYLEAAAQFTEWVFCNKKILQGLIRRRTAELVLYLDGYFTELIKS